MKENGTRRTDGAPARYRRAATVLVVGWGSCCALLVCDRIFLSGSGALSAALFYPSLLALLVCSLGAGRLLYFRPAPDPAAAPPGHGHPGILENLPCFVASLDGEGMNDYTNRRLLDYVGKGPAEVAGHRWMETIHPDEREKVRGEWLRCTAAGVAMDINHRMLRHDGAYRWHHARVEPSFDGRGRVARWHAVLTDIDDQVRAEEALRGRERRLRQLVDTIPAMLIINSPAGEVEYVNKPLVDRFGRGLESLRDSGWADLVHPEDAETLFARLRQAYANCGALDAEYRMLCADGEYRWMQCRKQPLLDGAGGVVCWYGVLTDVDDRKRAEEALRESERRLREMVDAIPGMLVVTSPGGEVEYINEPVRKKTGRSLESLKDLGWASMIHPEDVEELKGHWLSAVEAGAGMNPEYRQLCADGEYRWWQIRIEPFRDGGGAVTRWYGVITDIDDRKRAEQALREREGQLRLMVDAIPAMLFVAAPDGEIEYANRPLLDFLGQGVEALRGGGWVSMIHPDDAETQVNRWQAMVATGGSLETEFRVRRVDGVYRWFHSRVRPLRDGADGGGAITRWYGVITDDDDRRRAVEALRESEHQLRLTVETISALVWRATPQGWLDYVNQRGLDYTGRSLRDFAISGWLDLIHPDDAEQTVRRWRHSFETGEPFVAAYRFRGADGVHRWFQVRAEPLRDEEGRVARWYGLHIDIDEGRRMEEELRRSRERLAASMRLAALAELSASIAHEINQPLGALVANCHACQGWLAGDPPNVERARLVLDRVIRDGNAAADVVRRIRALFKEAAPAKELLDVNEVVVEAHRLVLDELRRKKVEVELELAPQLPPAPADRVQLQQVLVNLMHNGADALEAVRDRPRLLTVRTRRGGPDVVVEVADRGVGLQDVRRVFEPFFTTKEGGMGVGLAICRSIVEAHGGKIWAENREPRGAAFTFTLPADTEGGP